MANEIFQLPGKNFVGKEVQAQKPKREAEPGITTIPARTDWIFTGGCAA